MWEYRMVRKKWGRRGSTATTIGIHEAYYNKHGHVWMISIDPEEVSAEGGPKALAKTYKMMAEAFAKPVVRYEDIGHPRCRRCLAERAELEKEIAEAKPVDMDALLKVATTKRRKRQRGAPKN